MSRLVLVAVNVLIAVLAIVMMAETGASIPGNIVDGVAVLLICSVVTIVELRLIDLSRRPPSDEGRA